MPNLNPALDLLLHPYKGTNVYTILPAKLPTEEYVILGAHYDSKSNCPGAVDNATGTVMALSILAQQVKVPGRKKNLLVVLFDQEEEELIGSRAFVDFLLRRAYQVHSVHTFDMVGWDGDQNKEIELGAPSPSLAERYQNHAAQHGIPIYISAGGSTDYQAFLEAGFNATGVNEAYTKRDSSPYKDTPKDVFSTVNFDYLAHTTLFVSEVIQTILTE